MESTKETLESESAFKKPMLVGKIGRLPKKVIMSTKNKSAEEDDNVEELKTPPMTQTESLPAENVVENTKSLPYEEPNWSSIPDTSEGYSLETLKNGSILETIDLTKKPFWVFGRLPNCDICMQHPTISRYHAVLQYRKEKNENHSEGYYIYDLESTHGTFLNKNRIKPRNYVKVHVGHMLKLGCSTRTYILNGPEADKEEESELSVTELKQKRQMELLKRKQEELQEEEMRKKEEEKGIDWGMGEDADEETDLSENPYAETNNEDLYIDNPKKTLRGFFEREGLDLEYDCTEQGIGQFLCKIELPIDDEMGRPIFAEVFHKGKKKEAVVQCALEACRILDRHGLLRQATHESRKRKPKNWEENDYYDSDDDTFLDRTGAIEKKREKRMNSKTPQKAETYENLLEKEKKIDESIRSLEAQLAEAQRRMSAEESDMMTEADPLDTFMMELKQSKPSKQSVNKLKSEMIRLKQEHANVIKLINIAKPASLPPLVAEYATSSTTTIGSSEKSKNLPIFGKRKKIKVQLPEKPVESHKVASDDDDDEEVEEGIEKKKTDEEKFQELVKVKDGEHPQLLKISNNLKILASDSKLDVDELTFVKTKRRQILKLFEENRLSSEEIASRLDEFSNELVSIIEEKAKIQDVKEELKETDTKNMKKDVPDIKKEDKKKKNQRRSQLEEREAIERKKGYADYQNSEDYSMWVPPSGQTGDGRTALNDKYGY